MLRLRGNTVWDIPSRTLLRLRNERGSRVAREFAFTPIGDVSSVASELQDAISRAGERRPICSCPGILLDAGNAEITEGEFHHLQFLGAQEPDGINFLPQPDLGLSIHQYLLPYGNERVFQLYCIYNIVIVVCMILFGCGI